MNIWTSVFGFLSSVFSGNTGKIVESISDIAREVVKELDGVPGSGKAKKEDAFDTIKNRAMRDGIQVASHAINLAIELAVADLRD